MLCCGTAMALVGRVGERWVGRTGVWSMNGSSVSKWRAVATLDVFSAFAFCRAGANVSPCLLPRLISPHRITCSIPLPRHLNPPLLLVSLFRLSPPRSSSLLHRSRPLSKVSFKSRRVAFPELSHKSLLRAAAKRSRFSQVSFTSRRLRASRSRLPPSPPLEPPR